MYYATEELRNAVALKRVSGLRIHQLARRAGFGSPTRVSELLNGARPARPSDPRIQKLCELAGLRFDQAFKEDEQVAPLDAERQSA